MDNRFLFLGGDRRIIYTARRIAEHYDVSALGLTTEFSPPAGRYRYIVLPLPALKGEHINAPLSDESLPLSLVAEYSEDGAVVHTGGTPQPLRELCSQRGLTLCDYYADEALTLKNASLTAEGAVALLIQNTEYSLHGTPVLITGGGRISLMLARLLKCFGADVAVCARDPVQRMRASLEHCSTAEFTRLTALCRRASIVINTAPATLFSEEQFSVLQKGAVFMELASRSPEGEQILAAKYGVQHIMAGGLPGKLSPKTAGEAIAQTILTEVCT